MKPLVFFKEMQRQSAPAPPGGSFYRSAPIYLSFSGGSWLRPSSDNVVEAALEPTSLPHPACVMDDE